MLPKKRKNFKKAKNNWFVKILTEKLLRRSVFCDCSNTIRGRLAKSAPLSMQTMVSLGNNLQCIGYQVDKKQLKTLNFNNFLKDEPFETHWYQNEKVLSQIWEFLVRLYKYRVRWKTRCQDQTLQNDEQFWNGNTKSIFETLPQVSPTKKPNCDQSVTAR